MEKFRVKLCQNEFHKSSKEKKGEKMKKKVKGWNRAKGGEGKKETENGNRKGLIGSKGGEEEGKGKGET